MPARRRSKVVSLIALAQTGNESLTRHQAFDRRLDHTFALFLFGLRSICLMQVPLTLLAQVGGTELHMTTHTATSTTTVAPQAPSKSVNSAVAVYRHHTDAEDAVHRLERAGIPMQKISIIGRNFELREDVQGYYRPSDAALEGAGFGAWMGGLFGLLMGFGMFVFPIAGTLIVLGPLAGMIAGAVSGAGLGALVNGLMALGIPKDRALKYQSRLQAGEFLVAVTGTPEEVTRAKEILQNSGEIELETHGSAPAA